MTNPLAGEVEIELGGQTRVLSLSFEAFAQAAQLLDFGFDDFDGLIKKIAGDLQAQPPNMSTLFAVLTAALRDHWPEASVREVRRMVKPRDLPRIMPALVQAINEAMPVPEKGDEESEAPPQQAAA